MCDKGRATGRTQIFQKPTSHLKIPGTRRLTCGEFQTENPQILGTTLQNLVTWAMWCLGSVNS